MTTVFSKFAPKTQGRSFYQDLRRRGDDLEDQAGLLDEENLSHDFHEYDLEHAEGLGVEDSRTISGGTTGPRPRNRSLQASDQHREHRRPYASQEEDEDNDVPASLLVEAHEVDMEPLPGQQKKMPGRQSTAIPGPSHAGAQWEAAQDQQRLHDDGAFGPSRPTSGGVGGLPSSLFTGMVSGNAKKKAEWRWANVSNLDNFIKDVYDYYLGNGMGCILVERALHLV